MSEETIVLLEDNAPSHDDVVRHLAKPEADLVAEFGEDKAGITHMIMGMVTECRELVIAVFANDRVNVKEEIGDFQFYSVGLRQALARFYDDAYVPQTFPPIYDVAGFMLQTMNLMDFNKKNYAYDSDLNVQSLYAILDELDSKVQAFADAQQLSMQECIDHNRIKLWTKRYPNGFSNKAATDRLDKDGVDV